MFKIDWTGPALSDLREIEAWLEREASPEFSLRTLTAIRFRAKFWEDFRAAAARIAMVKEYCACSIHLI